VLCLVDRPDCPLRHLIISDDDRPPASGDTAADAEKARAHAVVNFVIRQLGG
jgi:hypothetical protein